MRMARTASISQSPEYTPVQPTSGRLLPDEGDGAKLQMEGLRYYANGLDYVDGPLILRLQMADKLDYDESVPPLINRTAKIVVNYQRMNSSTRILETCRSEFVLLQMVSGGDPDDLTVGGRQRIIRCYQVMMNQRKRRQHRLQLRHGASDEASVNGIGYVLDASAQIGVGTHR